MFTRSTLFLTSAALIAVALPAAAQDGRYGDAVDDIAWEQREVIQTVDDAHEDAEASYAHETGYARHAGDAIRHSQPRLAYSLEEREAWLADCRIVMRGEDYYYQDARHDADGDDDGGLLGGLLGAVVGGVAGNRIGGDGDRLAGTLLGAGIGGIAGAVIGSAIGSDEDEDDYGQRYDRDAEDAWASDYCEAYLRRYEASGQAGYGQMAYMQLQPVMMVTAPSRQGAVRETVREEWVDMPVEHREQRTRRRTVQRRVAAEPGKMTAVD